MGKVTPLVNENDGVPVFQLLQWKSAIKLEKLGMRHSSGRSVFAHAKRRLGIKGTHDEVITHINLILANAKAQETPRS